MIRRGGPPLQRGGLAIRDAHGFGHGPAAATSPTSAAPLATAAASVRRAAPSIFPKAAPAVAVTFVAVLGARVQEAVPRVAELLHPLILTLLVGGWILLPKLRFAAVRSAWSDRALQMTAAYFVWGLLTAPVAFWPGVAFTAAWKQIFTLLPMLVILLCEPTIENTRRLRAGIVAAVGGYALLFTFVAEETAPGRYGTRGMYDTNDSAALFALAVPLALYCATRERGRRRVVGIVGALFMVGAIVRTGSRGGVLALAVGSVLFALAQPGIRRWGSIALMVVGAALMWQFGTDTFRERIGGMIRGEEDYNQTSEFGREAIWRRGRMHAVRHPVAGVGMNCFQFAEGKYFEELGVTGRWMAPHNAYIQAFAELGVPGGVMFISILALSLRRAVKLARPRARDPMPDLMASLAAFAVGAYFLSHAYFFMGFALVALISLATRADANARASAYVTSAVRAGRPPAGPPLVAG